MQRLLLVLIFGLFCGGVIGAYAMSSLYGQRRFAEQSPTELVRAQQTSSETCAPCPKCKICAPQNDCEVPPPVVGPVSDSVFPLEETDIAKEKALLNGLPPRVLSGVVKELSLQLESCRSSSVAEGVIVDLTVTATGGFARISGAILVSEAENEALVNCFLENYSKPQLPWAGQDGSMKLRQVFNLGQ